MGDERGPEAGYGALLPVEAQACGVNPPLCQVVGVTEKSSVPAATENRPTVRGPGCAAGVEEAHRGWQHMERALNHLDELESKTHGRGWLKTG